MTPAPRHILVARTDRIGDLLLSLPVFQALRKAYPKTRLTALVSDYASPVVKGHPCLDAVETLGQGEGLAPLTRRFRALEADVFLSLYPRPTQAFAAALAGIPLRVGTAFRWYSFLYNHRVKVHRSRCDRHEADYNLDLVRALGVVPGESSILFPLTKGERSFAKTYLRKKGIIGSYLVLHPGHKGSALNWKPERYGEFLGGLLRKKRKVLVTGGPDEADLLRKVAGVAGKDRGKGLAFAAGELDLRSLAAVLEGARCLVSGSTGVMHLAAAVGTPTISLFCPIPATTPVRWGPWGNRHTVLMPQGLDCPDCRVGACRRHDPMDAILVGDVLKAVEKHLKK
jgi:ADP-heptose:LPS heptosyltransferase